MDSTVNYTEQLKQEVEAFKNRNNGIVSFTTKELLYSVNHKLDKITERLENGEKAFASINTTISWHSKLIGALYSIWGAVLIALLSGVNYLKRIIGG